MEGAPRGPRTHAMSPPWQGLQLLNEIVPLPDKVT
jgi:hypothetical protein